MADNVDVANNSFLILDPEKHRIHGFKPYETMHFAANDVCVPLVLAEIPVALAVYTLAFVKIEKSERFQLIALLGLHIGENLYVNTNGKWLADYTPSFYRGYPFSLQEQAISGERRNVICFDLQSGLYRENPDIQAGDLKFFDDKGQLQPVMQKLLTFFAQRAQNFKTTQVAVDALSEAELLVPWDLNVANPDPNRRLLRGLYCVDEVKLNALNSNLLPKLRDSNALSVAYAQIFSIPRTKILKNLYDLKYSVKTLPGNLTQKKSINGLFGEPDKDSLKFDWSKL